MYKATLLGLLSLSVACSDATVHVDSASGGTPNGRAAGNAAAGATVGGATGGWITQGGNTGGSNSGEGGDVGGGHGSENPGQICVAPMRTEEPACNGDLLGLMDRPYCLKVPAIYEAGSAVPLVLLLHGFNASGQTQADYFDFDALAERHGFLLAKPNGTKNRLDSRYWNASPACCAPKTGVVPDDVGYLSALLDDVQAQYSVDASRVYVVGHSNGGFMAHRLACDLSARLAAVVSLASAVDLESCAPSMPISVLEVHGTNDQVIHYEGGSLPTMASPYGSVDQTFSFWREANACEQPLEPQTFDLACDTDSPGEETERISSACAQGTSTEIWRMNGVGHIPAFARPNWPERVYAFLSAHTRAQE